MKRTILLSAAVLAGWLGMVSASQAQVFVRAPFVRVAVGDGVAVRAPFVNLWIPPDGPTYYSPFGPRVVYVQPPPPPVIVQPQPAPAPQPFVPPAPQPVPKPPIVDDAPPQPAQPAQVMTLEAFSKSFKAKAGSYELTLLNPVTKQPAVVRFTLPEGTPKRVHVTRDSIEFIYGLRQWVRIEFDRDGVQVTTR
jgi:hypothetical protein